MQKMNYITAEQARTRTLQAMQKDEKRRKNIEKANRIIQRRITSAIEAKKHICKINCKDSLGFVDIHEYNGMDYIFIRNFWTEKGFRVSRKLSGPERMLSVYWD